MRPAGGRRRCRRAPAEHVDDDGDGFRSLDAGDADAGTAGDGDREPDCSRDDGRPDAHRDPGADALGDAVDDTHADSLVVAVAEPDALDDADAHADVGRPAHG